MSLKRLTERLSGPSAVAAASARAGRVAYSLPSLMRFAWIRRLTYPRCRLRLAVNRTMTQIKRHWNDYLDPTGKKSSGPVGVGGGGRGGNSTPMVCVPMDHRYPEASYGCVWP